MNYRNNSTLFVCILFLFVLFVSGCTSNKDHEVISDSVRKGDYLFALEQIEDQKETLYTEKDKVLSALDLGILYHYSGDIEFSNTNLQQAESLISEYYSKSVTQEISSYIVNDSTKDYEGEEYEDIYTNIFMALNYIKVNDLENAMVEIRRFDNKLKLLENKYQEGIAKVSSNGTLDGELFEFHNSALARYLSMLLYRADDQLDSAEIDARMIDKAFSEQPHIYSFSKPKSLNDELVIPKGKARLNVLAFSGLSPTKDREELRINLDDTYIKVSLPYMVVRPSRITAIKVIAENVETGEIIERYTESIESIERVALNTFAQKRKIVYGKALLRSTLKAVTTAGLSAAADNADDSNVALILELASFASKVSTEATEMADVRVSHYFPAMSSVVGLTVDPGTYYISVQYLDSRGGVINSESFDNVSVNETGINLVESLCLN